MTYDVIYVCPWYDPPKCSSTPDLWIELLPRILESTALAFASYWLQLNTFLLGLAAIKSALFDAVVLIILNHLGFDLRAIEGMRTVAIICIIIDFSSFESGHNPCSTAIG